MDSFITKSEKRQNFIDIFFGKLYSLRASDAFLMKGALLLTFICILGVLVSVSTQYTISTPAFGGVLREGIIGTPRFVNPVLAVTRADRDLTALIYDGLMRLGKDGTLVPNIAESVTISEDGLTYNVVLKQNVYFHDGTKLTAADVAFTALRMQDPVIGSPLRANFADIAIEEVGEYELNFVLPEAYAPFIENLTFGILPEHTWKDAGVDEFPFSQYNSEAIGTGPYEVQEIIRSASGIPETYILKAHTGYHLSQPKIETIELHFFPTGDKLAQAFNDGVIESVAGVDMQTLTSYTINDTTHHIERIPLPRTFALFINQNKTPALRDLAARQALNIAIQRQALVDTTLGGYGNPLTSPLPFGFGPLITKTTPEESSADRARDILREGGWKLNTESQLWEKKIDDTVTPLSFSISTVNTGAFADTADFLKNAWAGIGAEVIVKQFEQSDLTQTIIRPRDYETLLFGMQLGRSLDYYSFWHSSQRNDPGLNIALYANITTDSILSEMRRSTETGTRDAALTKFVEEIEKESPALFLYSPELLYVFPNRITGATWKGVSEPHERWSNVHEWYIQTEPMWPLFNTQH